MTPNLVDRCATVRGWWGLGAVLVPEMRALVPGFRVMRPFSFVRAPNPSMGWPSWFALDAIIVDCGWVAADNVDSFTIRTDSKDPMLEEPLTIYGVLRNSPTSVEQLWQHLVRVADALRAAPHGANLLPIMLQNEER